MAKRPTETITGTTQGAVVYGFLTQLGLDPGIAAPVAVVAAAAPALISAAVDAYRRATNRA